MPLSMEGNRSPYSSSNSTPSPAASPRSPCDSLYSYSDSPRRSPWPYYTLNTPYDDSFHSSNESPPSPAASPRSPCDSLYSYSDSPRRSPWPYYTLNTPYDDSSHSSNESPPSPSPYYTPGSPTPYYYPRSPFYSPMPVYPPRRKISAVRDFPVGCGPPDVARRSLRRSRFPAWVKYMPKASTFKKSSRCSRLSSLVRHWLHCPRCCTAKKSLKCCSK